MTKHPSTDEMERFAARILPVPDLSVIAKHIAVCNSCHQSYQEINRGQRENSALAITLNSQRWFRHEHLEYEQLSAYVDSGNSLDDEEQEIIEIHLMLCSSCTDDVRSLKEFRRQIAPEMKVSYTPPEVKRLRQRLHSLKTWPDWWSMPAFASVAMAAAGVALFFGALLILLIVYGFKRSEQHVQQHNGAGSETTITSAENKPSVIPQSAVPDLVHLDAETAQNTNGQGGGTATVKNSSQLATTLPRSKVFVRSAAPKRLTSPAITLRDGEDEIRVNEKGNVTGLGNPLLLARNSTVAIKDALLAQKIAKPQELLEIVGNRGGGAQRAENSNAQSFTLLSPAQSVIASDRPVFRWEALPRASAYRVYVGDTKNRQILSSGELPASAAEWTSPIKLARDKVYTWAVIATVDGAEIIAPDATKSELRFKILSEKSLDEMTELRNKTRSHLALGVFYAKVGMIEDAERELQALVRQNPRSPLALRLLRSVQSWR